MNIMLGAALLENKRRRRGHVSSCRKTVGDINVALLAFVFISEGILQIDMTPTVGSQGWELVWQHCQNAKCPELTQLPKDKTR
jgi:hypothetical protein